VVASCLPDGALVTIAEIVERHMPVYEFGAEIIRRFDLKGGGRWGGQRPNVVIVYQDPANKSQTGTGHSVRDQINEVLAECDLAAVDGSNDRVGGRTISMKNSKSWYTFSANARPATRQRIESPLLMFLVKQYDPN
jgi:hypothetical protein